MKKTTIEPAISKEAAMEAIREKFHGAVFNEHYLDYWAYPQVFSNTAGPFSKPGMLAGAAMTTFTIEAWVYADIAVIFCRDKILKVTADWRGPQTVRL